MPPNLDFWRDFISLRTRTLAHESFVESQPPPRLTSGLPQQIHSPSRRFSDTVAAPRPTQRHTRTVKRKKERILSFSAVAFGLAPLPVSSLAEIPTTETGSEPVKPPLSFSRKSKRLAHSVHPETPHRSHDVDETQAQCGSCSDRMTQNEGQRGER